MKPKIIAHSEVHPREGGPYSLFCQTCGRWIPNTANSEMRKEGYFSHSHMCSKFEDGTIEIISEQGMPEKEVKEGESD